MKKLLLTVFIIGIMLGYNNYAFSKKIRHSRRVYNKQQIWYHGKRYSEIFKSFFPYDIDKSWLRLTQREQALILDLFAHYVKDGDCIDLYHVRRFRINVIYCGDIGSSFGILKHPNDPRYIMYYFYDGASFLFCATEKEAFRAMRRPH